MQTIEIGKSGLSSSRLIYGCMRIASSSASNLKRGRRALECAIDHGYTNFDHADIYAAGESERLFGLLLKESPALRDKVMITGKVGIRLANDPEVGAPGRYDFTREHILRSVEGSLVRLNTDYMDFLLLHRPDYLFCADEVAQTLEELRQSGKVKHVGVSNFKPSQVSLLQSRCSFDIQVNQIEMNIHNVKGLHDGTLDQCQELNITPQAWGPLGGIAYPAWGNQFRPEDELRIRREVDWQAEHYGVDNSIIALAWILAHPARIMPVIGSTDPERIKAAVKAFELDYSREHWYSLFQSRNGRPVD